MVTFYTHWAEYAIDKPMKSRHHYVPISNTKGIDSGDQKSTSTSGEIVEGVYATIKHI